MKLGRLSTIQRKLMTAIMGTSLTVLLLACALFISFEIITVRRNIVRGLTARAEMIAATASGALAFQNEADAGEVLAALKNDPHTLAACLYDKGGRVFARYPVNARTELFPAVPEKEGTHFGANEFVVFTPVMQGDRWFGTVYLKTDLEVLTERYRIYAMLVSVVIASAILLSFLLSTWLQRRLAQPILSLTNTAHAISGRKDYSLRAQKHTNDEIGVLTESFNSMLDEIQRAESSLRLSEARMRAILESALDCIITMDQEGRVVEFNPAAEQLFGYRRQDVIGQLLGDLIIPPALREQHRLGLRKYLETGENSVLGKRIEMQAVRANGTEFPVELAITRISQEEPPMFTGFIRDITARRRAEQEIQELNTQLEKRVIERTAQLAASNKELEAFSYSVSHDLRAPLRGIDGFTKVVIEDYGERLGEEGRRYLDRVRAATLRMSKLIDNLLELSRLGRVEMKRDLVELSAIARQISAELKQSQPERKVIFQITNGLAAPGDSALLRVVLDNLLRNAWKYTSKHPEARIEFGRTDNQNPAVFFVRDDGAGFDMAHADLLFAPFQRLHRQADFEGTGVGLATVQRIILRHGGRIWAESAVEKGATFYFTLGSS